MLQCATTINYSSFSRNTHLNCADSFVATLSLILFTWREKKKKQWRFAQLSQNNRGNYTTPNIFQKKKNKDLGDQARKGLRFIFDKTEKLRISLICETFFFVGFRPEVLSLHLEFRDLVYLKISPLFVKFSDCL